MSPTTPIRSWTLYNSAGARQLRTRREMGDLSWLSRSCHIAPKQHKWCHRLANTDTPLHHGKIRVRGWIDVRQAEELVPKLMVTALVWDCNV